MRWGAVLPFGEHMLYVYIREGEDSLEWLRRRAFKRILGPRESRRFKDDWVGPIAFKEQYMKPITVEEYVNDEEIYNIIIDLEALLSGRSSSIDRPPVEVQDMKRFLKNARKKVEKRLRSPMRFIQDSREVELNDLDFKWAPEISK
jgi:hypothetical protein